MTVNDLRILSLEKRLGPIRQLTPEGLMDMALYCETMCDDIGPMDPAFLHFAERKEWYFQAAALIEQENSK